MVLQRTTNVLGTAMVLIGCAACSTTLPASYEPQSIVRVEGTSHVGEFRYMPHVNGGVEANQIRNTAVGTIYIGDNVGDFVRRATALEMEASGITLSDRSPRVVEGTITELVMDDLGYSVDWSYAIQYRVIDTTTRETVFERSYQAKPRTTGKFGQPSDYTSTLNDLVRGPIEEFLKDERSMDLL